jgi:dipeptidyl aminopeptidase/acylaminoacyl peptidase
MPSRHAWKSKPEARMAVQLLDLEALLRVPHADTEFRFDISPDGTQVAFSYNPSGAWEIYVLPLADPGALHPISAGPGAKFAPRWSPDGRKLMYALDVDGSEAHDLMVTDLESREKVNLTPQTPELILPLANWSPDGTMIALVSDRTGRFEVHIVRITGERTSIIPGHRPQEGDLQDWEAVWSPDGHRLSIVTRAEGQDAETYLVSPEDGEASLLRDPMGPLHAREAAWSPDGTRIAFSSNRDGRNRIGLYDIHSGDTTWLPREDAHQERPDWGPDGGLLAYLHGNGPQNKPVIFDLGKGSPRDISIQPGTYSHPRFTPDGRQLLFLFENESHPPDLWSFDIQTNSCRQLTRSLPEELAHAPFVAPEHVRYPSLDGASVPALLYRPTERRGLGPAVILVHGGPTWLSRRCWNPVVAHMVGRGWLVLAPNYRGSTGYGRDWQWANRFDLGGGDTGDIVAGADYLVKEGWADPDRVAITGVSYGGYLTMTAMTGYPDRWAVGSADVPFLNWFTEYENEREDLRHWDRENMGVPEENPALFRERSPYFALDRIRAPVQLIAGENDPRCPAGESVEAAKILEEKGVEHELFLLHGQGHGALLTDIVVESEARLIAFLARALER